MVDATGSAPPLGVGTTTSARPVRRGAAARLTLIALAVFILSIYLLTASSDLSNNGDTYLRYQTAQALVDSGHVWIEHPKWLDTRVHKGVGGHLYAFYAPGQALLMVPLYVAGKFVAHHLSLPYDITTLYACRLLDLFLGALLALVFYRLCLSIGYERRVSAGATLLLAFATPAWPDAQSGLEQTQLNLCLLAAVYCVWRYVQSDFQSVLMLCCCAAAVGAGALTRYDFLLYAPILIAFPIVSGRGRMSTRKRLLDVGIYVGTLLPFVAALAFWDYLRFGSIFETGLTEASMGESMPAGLAGLLVSPGKGLLWYMPLLFLLPFCFRRFLTRSPGLFWLGTTLMVVTLALFSNLLYWHGDPAWGPRYLYPLVPFLVLPVVELLRQIPRMGIVARALLLVMVGLSVALQASAVSVTQWRFWYRLQALEERTSQPFEWGATHYHYYWSVRESPILIQVDDVLQVARLNLLGEARYRLTARPTVFTAARHISNPADFYPVNTFAFWWSDTMHPLLGERRRSALAAALAGTALVSGAFLFMVIAIGKGSTREPLKRRRLNYSPET